MRGVVSRAIVAFVLLATSASAQQSVFDFASSSPGGNFTGPVVFSDGSQISAEGLRVSPSSNFIAPDTSIWTPAGLTFSPTDLLTFPDRSTVGPTGVALAAASILRGPDTSTWSNGGLAFAQGKTLALANGTASAPSLSFAQQATAGWYREGVDDLRLALSGSILALRAYKANATTGVVSVPLGASTGFAVLGGRICTSTAAFPTTLTTIQIVSTCTLPANALSTDGTGIKVKAWGTTAANGNNKTLEIYFGSTKCATMTGAVNNGVMVVESTILRTGAATQECIGHGITSLDTVNATRATPGETLSGNVDVTVKATTPTAIVDLTFRGITVELLN